MFAGVFRNQPLHAALLAVLLLAGVSAGAGGIACDVCGRKIRPGENYYRKGGKILCSRDFERSLPVCSVCGKKCRGGYSVSDGKVFCSEKCFRKVLPVCTICGRPTASWSAPEDGSYIACPECRKNPPCFVCGVPRTGRKLPDGRTICRQCRGGAVTDPEEAKRHFRKVRRELRERFDISTGHRIEFALTDRERLHRLAGNRSDSTRELGLFVHHVRRRTVKRRDPKGRVISQKTETVAESFNIYALDYLTREYLEYVCAHELGHDWQVEHYPNIKDPSVREGFAEYVGWLYNRMHGRHQLNRRIEKNVDPVYGDGFRRITAIADREGFAGVRRFLESKNR